MNETLRPKLAMLAALAALTLSACSPAASDEPPLKGAPIGGPFTLIDQNGREVSDSQFKGKYRLVYFGYTFCPDVCPVDLQSIGQAMRRFEKSDGARAAKVQPIFITTDPARDTPAVLKQYVGAFHPRLIGLTGNPQQIEEVKKRFAIWSEKQDTGTKDYLVNHPRLAILMDPEGEPIALVPHDKGAEAIAAELDRWVT